MPTPTHLDHSGTKGKRRKKWLIDASHLQQLQVSIYGERCPFNTEAGMAADTQNIIGCRWRGE